jgi:hypothetical protein
MEREIEAALAALARRFGPYVGTEGGVFVAFSLGAIYGVPYLQKHAARFPRAVLIEGGFESWSPVAARAFASGGGQRVLFACGQASCQPKSRKAARVLEAAGVMTKVAYKAPVGHTYDGPVAESVLENLDWLLGGQSDAGDDGGGGR